MIIVALVLIVIVAVFVLAVVLSSRAPVQLDPTSGSIDLSIFGADLPVSELGLVCAGAGAMLLLVIAVLLLRLGFRRARADRKYQKTLAKSSGAGATTAAKPRGEVSGPSDTTGPDGARTSGASGHPSAPAGSTDRQAGVSDTDHSALLDEVDRITGDDQRS